MKKILVGAFLLLAIVLVGFRITHVNQGIELPPVETYSMNQEVPLAEDYLISPADAYSVGYTVRANQAEVLSYEDYLKKYDYVESAETPLFDPNDMMKPEMIYELNVTFKNTNEHETEHPRSGVNLIGMDLNGLNFGMQVSYELMALAHPKLGGEVGFRLRPGDTVDLNLPFGFSPGSQLLPIKTENIKNNAIYWVLTLYPTKKQILIK